MEFTHTKSKLSDGLFIKLRKMDFTRAKLLQAELLACLSRWTSNSDGIKKNAERAYSAVSLQKITIPIIHCGRIS